MLRAQGTLVYHVLMDHNIFEHLLHLQSMALYNKNVENRII